MNKKKIALISVSALLGATVLAVAIPFTVLAVKTANIKSDYAYLIEDAKYKTAVEVEGLEHVTQEISCGYATIEMMSAFYGERVSEETLSERNNGAITTSSSSGFLSEINKTIKDKEFKKSSYLKNDELLKEIHDSLSNNNPVAIEWAAKYKDEWTLHFSVISALDLEGNNIRVYNPYGYIENLPIDTFIGRSTFEAYKDMPLFLNFGFAFGAFEKNAIFHV
ncbi:MAG: C39 family peptidase [Bacilli bacterium]|nr:C39 family peptidase [Bacilli bacterium]